MTGTIFYVDAAISNDDRN